jgi:hypothetical protein
LDELGLVTHGCDEARKLLPGEMRADEKHEEGKEISQNVPAMAERILVLTQPIGGEESAAAGHLDAFLK